MNLIRPWMLLGSLYGVAVYSNLVIQKNNGLKRTLALSGAKGIINLGAGCERTGFSEYVCALPEVKVNIDLSGECQNCQIVNLENAPLPFNNKEFDVAFGSHVLEHLVNWEQALDEWTRIADHVIIVLPNPLSIIGWVYLEHKQHFNFSGITYIRNNWPTVEVFY